MNPHDVFLEARKRGLRIAAAGDKLAVMPKGACPPDFADVLRQHKTELLDWLSRPPCPAWRAVPPSDLPLHPLPPRPTPADARRVVDFITRQTNGADALCDWCLRRELAYWTAYHWPDALCCYAAARDAACWQWNRSEADVWTFLQATQEAAAPTRAQRQTA